MEGDNNAGGFEFYLFRFRFCNFMKNKGKFLPLNHYHIKKYKKIYYTEVLIPAGASNHVTLHSC